MLNQCSTESNRILNEAQEFTNASSCMDSSLQDQPSSAQCTSSAPRRGVDTAVLKTHSSSFRGSASFRRSGSTSLPGKRSMSEQIQGDHCVRPNMEARSAQATLGKTSTDGFVKTDLDSARGHVAPQILSSSSCQHPNGIPRNKKQKLDGYDEHGFPLVCGINTTKEIDNFFRKRQAEEEEKHRKNMLALRSPA
jgi:hypothetical protein